MYPTSGASIRHDLNTVVEEAFNADEGFIGARVMPPLKVDTKSGEYPKLKIANAKLLELGSSKRSPDGSYSEIIRAYDTDTYLCEDRGLEERIDDVTQRDLARFFSVEAEAARLTLRNMQLDHESRVKSAIMNPSTFTATAASVNYTVANKATVDFPGDVLAAISRCRNFGVRPNTIVMSEAVFFRLASTTILQSWLRGTLTGNIDTPVNAANIARAFADYGITQVLVGGARYNSAKTGATLSIAEIWPTTYVWVGYVNPSAVLARSGGAGFTFTWNEGGGLFVTETYRDERRSSNMVRVKQFTTEKIVDSTAGQLITTSYS